MLQNAIFLEPENAKKFNCNFCDFKCCKKSNFYKHNLTLKHINATKMLQNATNLMPKNAICINCNKSFKHSSSMYRHKKICNKLSNTNIKEDNNNLVEYLIKENSELKTMILDVCKSVGNTNNNHSFNTNSNNKTFNLHFFLNETCKNAMNIMDFVDSIKLQLSDLEKVGEIGYVDGISNIITSNLNALDISLRPIHCTDKKREVLYVKDENKWEKEDEEKLKLKKAIKRVASKNQRLLPVFKEEHPDCIKSSSPFSDQYNKMIVESMGGSGDNDSEKEDKIIKKITNVTTIDKTYY
jgi:hypothetical protein